MPELQETGIRCQVLCECKEFQGLGLYLHSNFPTGENMTKDEIIEMLKQVGIRFRRDVFYSGYCDGVHGDELEAFAKLVAQHEREACAELCEMLDVANPKGKSWDEGTIDCANAIRARGQA